VILALESSCDETAIAAFSPEKGVVANWTTTQTAIHERHGGVVPDLATREHLRHFGPLIEQARHTLDIDSVETVAVTRGPGLAACLALGLAAAKALGLALRRPVVGVNHLRAHAWSPFIPVTPGLFGLHCRICCRTSAFSSREATRSSCRSRRTAR
jgi:N6-L-threonylcarbamoyladenine synthase